MNDYWDKMPLVLLLCAKYQCLIVIIIIIIIVFYSLITIQTENTADP